MSIDMYVSASQRQAANTSKMTKQQIQGYEQLQTAINDFVLTSHLLTGQTYDSAKAFFSQVMYPLSQGGILLSEAIEEAVKTFPEEYISNVDSGDLKQSELEDKINRANRLIDQAEDIGRQIKTSSVPETTKIFQLVANAGMVVLYRNVKHELEEKLQKLMEFNSNSVRLFSKIESLEVAVSKGVAQSSVAFNSSTGTFKIPSKKDLGWATTISAAWNVRIDQVSRDKIVEIEVIENRYGTFYKVFVDGVYDQKATENYTWLQVKSGLTDLGALSEVLLMEIFEINNAQRLLEGKDPITGEELNAWKRSEAGLWMLVSFVSIAKLPKMIKQFKAGKSVLNGTLTAKELELLSKSKVWGDIGKSAKVAETTFRLPKNLEKVLTPAQVASIKKLHNNVVGHLKDSDFSGTLRDLQGNPVPVEGRPGEYYDHLQEMKNTYTSLNNSNRSITNSLKNPNLTKEMRFYLENEAQKAQKYIDKIDDLFYDYGGIDKW